ncbi:hypothetical protein ACN28S_01250 [Cystobacter fuscus]
MGTSSPSWRRARTNIADWRKWRDHEIRPVLLQGLPGLGLQLRIEQHGRGQGASGVAQVEQERV